MGEIKTEELHFRHGGFPKLGVPTWGGPYDKDGIMYV